MVKMLAFTFIVWVVCLAAVLLTPRTTPTTWRELGKWAFRAALAAFFCFGIIFLLVEIF